MPHNTINSKADFDKAVGTSGKYVLIYGYEGTPSDKADEMADKFAATTDAYSVDLAKHADVKEALGVSGVPAIVVYKDGSIVKKTSGGDEAARQEIIQLLS